MNSGKRKPACSGIGANSDGTGSRLGIVHLCPGRKGFPGYTGQSMGNPGPWSESSSPPCPLLHAPPRKERVSGSGSHLHGELGHHGGALVRGGLQVQLPTHVDRPLPHDRKPQGALPETWETACSKTKPQPSQRLQDFLGPGKLPLQLLIAGGFLFTTPRWSTRGPRATCPGGPGSHPRACRKIQGLWFAGGLAGQAGKN